METTQVLSMVYGALIMMMGWLLKRVLGLLDELRHEDSKLHSRISDLAHKSVSRDELQGNIDRVLTRIDKFEERLIGLDRRRLKEKM